MREQGDGDDDQGEEVRALFVMMGHVVGRAGIPILVCLGLLPLFFSLFRIKGEVMMMMTMMKTTVVVGARGGLDVAVPALAR